MRAESSHLCHECPKLVPRIGWCPILAQRRLRNQPMCAWALENRMWEGGEPYAPLLKGDADDRKR